ncbi:RNA polymerase sigma factor [Chitinophaga sp. 22620]|uniref:RNA polymerase sigma factor n=1 Tax=Chitinophaga sp. 22620 TaxID=3453952 RepID=UPI003F86D2C2
MQNDMELLERLKQNDTEAFGILFDRYWEGLFLFAWKRLKSKQDAEDVVQQVFMKIWEHRTSRTITYSLQAYLYRSVSYEVIDALKNMTGSPEDLDAVNEHILPVFNDILEKLTADELNELINAEINALPQRMQQVYRLSREEDLSITEIAQKLEISEQTVKNQLTTALSRLRKPIMQVLLLMILQDITWR